MKYNFTIKNAIIGNKVLVGSKNVCRINKANRAKKQELLKKLSKLKKK